DETVGYVLMLRLADYLLSNYASDPRIQRMVDSIDIWINPLANPDGTYRFGNQSVAGASRYNANWVDINRNFPDPEDGPHPDGFAWQPETQIFMNFASSHNFGISCNIHGGAEVCNYPWDTWYAWQKLHPDDIWWQFVCNEYADTAQLYSPSGYLDDFGTGVTHGATWYSIDGGRQDYMNYFHHCREFTLEISSTKLPSASLLPNYWNYNYRSLLNYMEQSLNGLHGLVTDSLTGQFIHAKVFITGHDADSSHVYSDSVCGDYYRYLPTGTYAITFSCPGYLTKTIPGISITQGQSRRLDVELKPEGFMVTGQVVYSNNLQSPLASAWVYLKDSIGNILDSTITDTGGNFGFELQIRGNYSFMVSPQTGWGGVNTSDALGVMTHFTQQDTISPGLERLAADVNSSGSINSTDALLIQRRFVGLTNSFARPDWIYEETLQSLEPQSQVILRLICTGDVNASYSP
ncbi:MAG: carboxypeptidase regulatory-like domain-containing protein, partial [Bacteroidales bacterium]|nr:carboxypeptidase regulatory-like domain-containing protein [Bacteroidales bacterium]